MIPSPECVTKHASEFGVHSDRVTSEDAKAQHPKADYHVIDVLNV